MLVVWASSFLWIALAPALWTLLSVLQWRSFPFPDSDRIVQVNAGLDLAPTLAATRHFSAVSVYETGVVFVESRRGARSVVGAAVDSSFFEVLGVRPLRGGVFEAHGRAPAQGVVVAKTLAQRLLGGADRQREGLRVGGRTLTVVGVVPDRPVFPPTAEVWFARTSQVRVDGPLLPPDLPRLGILARLSPGTKLPAATAGVLAAASDYERKNQIMQGDVEVVPLARYLRRSAPGERALLAAALGCLLAFLFAATSGCLWGFVFERRRELFVRLAVGASRLALVRLLLLRLAIQSLPGLLLGLPVAYFSLSRLDRFVPYSLAQLLPPRLGVESVVASFAIAALVATLACAWVVLSEVGPAKTYATIADGAGVGRRQAGRRMALIAGSLSVAVALCALTAVLRASVARLENEPLGFEPAGVMTGALRFRATVPLSILPRTLDRLRGELLRVPGIAEVAFASALPFRGSNPHLEVATPGGDRFWMGRIVSIHGPYLRALGVRRVRGREITEAELESGAAVALLDEASAETLFDHVAAPGGTIRVNGEIFEVVGIVSATKGAARNEPSRPQVYQPLRHGLRRSPLSLSVALRISRPVSEERLAMTGRGLGLSLDSFEPLHEGIDRAEAPRKLARDLATLESWATLLLAALASFGAFSWWLGTRSHEFAVRLALGDTRAGIAARVLRATFGWLAAALGAGLVLYLPIVSALRVWLYGVHPLDPRSLGIALVQASAPIGAAAILALRGALRRPWLGALRTPGE